MPTTPVTGKEPRSIAIHYRAGMQAGSPAAAASEKRERILVRRSSGGRAITYYAFGGVAIQRSWALLR